MRLFLLTAAIGVIAVSAASLKPELTDNAFAYANAKSREFSKGDSGKPHGWRECVELENTGRAIGMVCEGTRLISIPNGQTVDVNYFCEFRFIQVDAHYYRLDHSLCQ